MTYTSGNLILATDYNGFATSVNSVWNSNYGQTSVSPVAAGGTVTATQWATLNTTIASMAGHQGTAITSRTNPTVGNVIGVLANVATDIASCVTKTANAATQGTQYTAWTGTSSKTTATGSGVAAWTITFTQAITFANTTAASNFFNSGGLVKIQYSKTSTGTTQDTEWNTFINTVVGTIYLSSTGASKTINGVTYTGTTKIGGSGTPATLATSTGFAQLTSSPVIIYKQFDSGAPYSANYVQTTAQVSGAVLTLVTTWYDAGDPLGADISGGTATTGIAFGTAPATVATYTPPETTYLTNVWGTPTVAATVT
jgi:hypothetical protein